MDRFDNESLELENDEKFDGEEILKFKVVGIFPTVEYQKCKSYVQKLHQSYPMQVQKPFLRPMLDFDWNEFIIKVRRQRREWKLWALEKPVAVFVNDKFIGDDDDLTKYLLRKRFKFGMYDKDFDCMGKIELKNFIHTNERDFIYMSIDLEGKTIGTFLIMLYSELVPDTCSNFLRLCLKKRKGYTGVPIHRIVKGAWIQVGGFNLVPKKMPCENYAIPHDRKGVLAMCNKTKHVDNTTQFLISLNPQPWMTYYYVAFGQIIHGYDLLNKIENVPTHYESPLLSIKLTRVGKYSFYEKPFKNEKGLLDSHINTEDSKTYAETGHEPRIVGSVMLPSRYKKGLYFLPTDLQSHRITISDYLLQQEEVEEESLQYPKHKKESRAYNTSSNVVFTEEKHTEIISTTYDSTGTSLYSSMISSDSTMQYLQGTDYDEYDDDVY